MRSHRRQPTRLPRPWDSPGKNTGVGCHFLLQCMKVKSQNEVAQSCPTLKDLTDCSPPGSSIHGIFQARVLAAAAAKSLQSCPTLCDPIDIHLQGIFPTQELNPGLLHCKQILYQLSCEGSLDPILIGWYFFFFYFLLNLYEMGCSY